MCVQGVAISWRVRRALPRCRQAQFPTVSGDQRALLEATVRWTHAFPSKQPASLASHQTNGIPVDAAPPVPAGQDGAVREEAAHGVRERVGREGRVPAVVADHEDAPRDHRASPLHIPHIIRNAPRLRKSELFLHKRKRVLPFEQCICVSGEAAQKGSR